MESLIKKVGGMYVDEDGFLMCGPEGRSTSMVEGLKCTWHNEDDLSLRIEPINDLGEICGEHYR